MHKFTSNIPLIVNNISTMQDVSAQNMDLSGSLDVSQNTTIGGDLSVAGDVVVAGDLTAENLIVGSTNVITELTSLDTRLDTEEQKTTALQTLTASHTEDITANTNNIASLDVDLFFSTAKLASANTFTANQSITGDLSVTEATALSSLSVSGNETVGGTLGVTNTTTLTGNVGIGGASGSHNLLVTGSERITGNLDVSGDLTVTGNFNFSEVIQNITTVNNEVIISTQLDISNQGTGPALKVSQFGVGEDQDVAVFNAGDEGDAFKIDYAGNSHFYKPVEMNQTFDTILIRRTDAVGGIINLRTLQVFVNGVNILPSSTNSTQSILSGSIGNVIEFMTWNNSVVSGAHTRASNIRLNNIQNDFSVHSLGQNTPYISLYIPLTQSFSISGAQSVVLYNRGVDSRINGFQIELYNRSNGFTPGTNVLYTMPIDTNDAVYRFDLPSISSYTGFSSVDSTDKIKTVTVSYSYFNTTLLKVEGGNVEFGGGLSVTGNTSIGTLNTGQLATFPNIFTRSGKNGGVFLKSSGSYSGTGQNFFWKMVINSDGPNIGTTETGGGGDLYFWHGNAVSLDNNSQWGKKGYISTTVFNKMNFTGQHRCFIKDLPFSNTGVYEGRIVCADQNTNISMSDKIRKGNQAITQNETLPYVSLSTKNKDKSCFGVISASEDPNERVDRYGAFCTPFEKEKGDTRVYINSVGEGALWVSNKNGTLESGDYITTCDLSGYGTKQDDDILHNYTVAKITMDCDFSPRYVPIPSILKDASGENVLDAYDQLQWTDASGDYEYEYNIRYINREAQIITYEEYDSSYDSIVAYVGCTYHCG